MGLVIAIRESIAGQRDALAFSLKPEERSAKNPATGARTGMLAQGISI
jgi:hypothetical protein